MRVLEKISSVAVKYMAIVVVLVACIAVFLPVSFSWIQTRWINILLSVVMFGMGLTLKGNDFRLLLTQPKNVLVGLVAQFTLMPGIAYLLVHAFNLPLELAVGVILVGCSPGGTASNVMTYLAKGDVALSVSMTAVSTLFAPILTPFLTVLLIGEQISVNYLEMFLSIISVVIIPIVIGVIFAKFLSQVTSKIAEILPLISVVFISLIIGAIVSLNSTKILTNGLLIFVVIILHNTFGLLTGYGVAKLFRLPNDKCNTISIEVGMQNSGLATTLALTHFASMPAAAIVGALFSVWHNISGSIVANIMALRAKKNGN